MGDYILKFFSYYENTSGIGPYSDGLGEGAFELRHIIWMIITVLLVVLAFDIFKKHPVAGRKVVVVFATLLFLTRFVNQIFRAIIGAEVPWTQAFPFHMCTVLTFLLPIVAIFNIKKLKAPIYVLGIMGGTITILNGDYFDNLFLSFAAIEGMSAHMLLILIPVIEIATDRFELKIAESWKVPVGMLVFMGWATLANRVFYAGMGTNYMYLEHNSLPFGDEQNYFLFYTLIFIVFLTMIYGLPLLAKLLKHRFRREINN
ncbi:MAG: hypothetical protein WC088_03160 [Candidatus Izemoplasmatales bacterium]|jgi:uncharacterized membrane protein YwaF